MKKVFRIGLTIVICAGMVVGYYYYLSQKNDKQSVEPTEKLTEVEKIVSRDFKKDYPSKPREVIKWYNRIISAYYNEEYSDKELEKMAEQARILMDEELREQNTKDVYLKNLKADIEDYKNRDREIIQARVCDSNDIRYDTVEGHSCAFVEAYYFVKEGSDYSRTYQQFVLRKDKEGQWKILTFRLIEGETDDE